MTAVFSKRLTTLETAITDLETSIAQKETVLNADQGELFGVSQEQKTLNKTIASKLDSTIERLETLLQE